VFAHNPFFQAKLVLLLLAGLNALLYHRLGQSSETAARAAALSLGLWALVLICGRAIAYW
jgi:hypothetical protein